MVSFQKKISKDAKHQEVYPKKAEVEIELLRLEAVINLQHSGWRLVPRKVSEGVSRKPIIITKEPDICFLIEEHLIIIHLHKLYKRDEPKRQVYHREYHKREDAKTNEWPLIRWD